MKSEKVMELFPEMLKKPLKAARIQTEEIEEIRIRVNRPLYVQAAGQEREIEASFSGTEVEQILSYLGGYSLYAYEEEVRQGFLTLPGGHRVGVSGKAVLEEGKIIGYAGISSLNIRFAKEQKGCADPLMPFLADETGWCHTLIVSPPGGGKTTMLRDCIRQISDGTKNNRGRTVGIVDERSEIAGCWRGIPENDVGKRTDVLDGCPKVYGMMQMIRTMAPEVLAVDEIGTEADSEALLYASNCGCVILASAHGTGLEDLLKKPAFQTLFGANVFQRVVLLEGRFHPGRIQQVLNGEGIPLC